MLYSRVYGVEKSWKKQLLPRILSEHPFTLIRRRFRLSTSLLIYRPYSNQALTFLLERELELPGATKLWVPKLDVHGQVSGWSHFITKRDVTDSAEFEERGKELPPGRRCELYAPCFYPCDRFSHELSCLDGSG